MTAAALQPAMLARRIGLVLILFFGTQGLVAGLRGQPDTGSAFFLCLYIHLWVSVYDGIFEGARKLSWLAMNLIWVGAMLSGFLGYVLPWGQVYGWLATRAVDLFGEPLASELFAKPVWVQSLLAVLAVVPTLILVLDIFLMQRRSFRRGLKSRRLLLSAIGAIGLGVMVATLSGPPEAIPPAEVLPAILPEWFLLPFYAVLRCLPDKLASIVLMASMMMLPLVVPWMGAARCRLGPARQLFLGLCAVLALCSLLLGWLGAQIPTEPSVWAVRILVLYYFCFFLILVPALSLWTRRHQASHEAQASRIFD